MLSLLNLRPAPTLAMNLSLSESTVRRRFNMKIGTRDGCWIWDAATANGYGVMCVGEEILQAHRLSYRLFYGEEPGELCVCHHCDVKRCVQPMHLFLGSPSDNLSDAYEKGFLNHLGHGPTADWIGPTIYNPKLVSALDDECRTTHPRRDWFPTNPKAVPA
jgi:hypothetical protein